MNTPTRREMTLPTGETAPVDFEGNGGKLSAVFKTGDAAKVAAGQSVTVDGNTLKVSETFEAREGYTAVIAVPANYQARPVALNLV